MTVDKNPKNIQDMFNKIAKHYDKNNNLISLWTHSFIKSAALKELNIQENMSILDLCCGTGDIIKLLFRINNRLNITGIDFSDNMLEIASKKFKNNKNKPQLIKADITDLPLNSNSFDCITEVFGLRNVQERKLAIKEIHRLLKADGEFLHMDFGNKNIFSSMFDIIIPIIIKILYGNNLPYKYLINSKKEFPTPENLIKEFEANGFKLKMKKNYIFGVISMQIYTISDNSTC